MEHLVFSLLDNCNEVRRRQRIKPVDLCKQKYHIAGVISTGVNLSNESNSVFNELLDDHVMILNIQQYVTEIIIQLTSRAIL